MDHSLKWSISSRLCNYFDFVLADETSLTVNLRGITFAKLAGLIFETFTILLFGDFLGVVTLLAIDPNVSVY